MIGICYFSSVIQRFFNIYTICVPAEVTFYITKCFEIGTDAHNDTFTIWSWELACQINCSKSYDDLKNGNIISSNHSIESKLQHADNLIKVCYVLYPGSIFSKKKVRVVISIFFLCIICKNMLTLIVYWLLLMYSLWCWCNLIQ